MYFPHQLCVAYSSFACMSLTEETPTAPKTNTVSLNEILKNNNIEEIHNVGPEDDSGDDDTHQRVIKEGYCVECEGISIEYIFILNFWLNSSIQNYRSAI